MIRPPILHNPDLQLFIKNSPVYPAVRVLQLRHWILNGRPVPPPNVVKQRTVQEYANRYQLDILIETGTFWGDMVAASKDRFSRIISVELSDYLYERAKKRFAKYPHIELIHGDSGLVVPQILEQLQNPALFWLDAHAMNNIQNTARAILETPIIQEVDKILSHPVKDHVILIDDARFFNGEHDYPTLDEFQNLIQSRRKDMRFEVLNDSIRLVPRVEER